MVLWVEHVLSGPVGRNFSVPACSCSCVYVSGLFSSQYAILVSVIEVASTPMTITRTPSSTRSCVGAATLSDGSSFLSS